MMLRQEKDMKLIDILIENGIQWPDGADGVVQDADGDVKFYAGKKPIIDGGVWLSGNCAYAHKSIYLQTASDYNTAIITKQEWENGEMAMFADVKVGDNVWDSRKGWGVVTQLDMDDYYDYPILVTFTHDSDTYTLDGCYHEEDAHPSLFWDEIEIKAPPKPLPKLEVDTKVVVWQDDGSKERRHFSHFGEDGVLHVFAGGLTSFSGVGTTTAWDNWELAE